MTLLPAPPAAPPGLPAELLWQVLDAADVGVLVTDARRRIVYANATFTRETGYPLAEVAGRTCRFLQGPGTDPADIAALRAALDRAEPVERVILNYRRDGTPLHYRLRIRPLVVEGALKYFVGVQEDHSAAHAAQLELERWAYLDALTGLGNRRAFDERLTGGLAEALAGGQPLALWLLDLNGFKQINDERGHPAGDALLQAVARALEAAVGEAGQAFRLGGDEFAVLRPAAGEGAAAPDTGHDLLAALEALEGGTLRAGLGGARCPDEARDAAGLLRLADRRLYRHKAEARQARRASDR